MVQKYKLFLTPPIYKTIIKKIPESIYSHLLFDN